MPFDTKVDKMLESEIDKQGEKLTIRKRVEIEGHHIHYFKDLRSSDGISSEILLESLDPEKNSSNVFKAGEASGASGSFFFFSADKRFIVKTMNENEKKFFLDKVARPYFEHMKKNPNSLLARIYGVYTVKI
jgi:1-phosphatidylinositol-4-phosphate 5-kinase